MSRKDFIVLAKALHDQASLLSEPEDKPVLLGVELATFRIADALEETYPNFDHARFLKAALVEVKA